MPKVTVCIPIYKAEKYIEQSARSLFEQSLDDIEYIFINDCTPDRSIQILQQVLLEYPNRKNQVKLLHHPTNLNVSIARQTGIDAATGEYIIMCDSDDMTLPNMYEVLYQAADSHHADIVYCDLNYIVDNKTSYIHQSDTTGGIDAVKKILRSEINSNLSIKLVRSSIYKNNVHFSEIRPMWDDTLTSIYMFYKAKTVVHIPQGLFNYISHMSSICNTTDLRVFARHATDVIHNSNKIVNFIRKMPSHEQHELHSDLCAFLFKAKWHLLNWWEMDASHIASWRNLWPEILQHLPAIKIPKWKKYIYKGLYHNTMTKILIPMLSLYKKVR